jgi:hypothetical protein
MNPDRRQQIGQLYHTALELEPEKLPARVSVFSHSRAMIAAFINSEVKWKCH